MTDDASRPNGSTPEPMAFDEDEKKLLRAAFDPTPARVEAVRGAVVARIAALAAAGAGASAAGTASAEAASAAASAGGAGATTSAALAWSAAHWIGVGVVAIAVAGGAVVALRTEPSLERGATDRAVAAPASPAAVRTPAATSIARPAAPVPAAAVVEPGARERSGADELRDDAARDLSRDASRSAARAIGSESSRTASAAPGRPTPARAHAQRGQVERRIGSTTSEEARDTPDEPSAVKAQGAQPEPPPSSAQQPAAQPLVQPVAESLGRELALLRKARAALERGSAPLALSLLDEYGTLFPQGVLRQEELATRALALCESGRRYEARQAARTLARLAPRSPHLIRLADSCALRETTSEHDADEVTDDR